MKKFLFLLGVQLFSVGVIAQSEQEFLTHVKKALQHHSSSIFTLDPILTGDEFVTSAKSLTILKNNPLSSDLDNFRSEVKRLGEFVGWYPNPVKKEIRITIPLDSIKGAWLSDLFPNLHIKSVQMNKDKISFTFYGKNPLELSIMQFWGKVYESTSAEVRKKNKIGTNEKLNLALGKLLTANGFKAKDAVKVHKFTIQEDATISLVVSPEDIYKINSSYLLSVAANVRESFINMASSYSDVQGTNDQKRKEYLQQQLLSQVEHFLSILYSEVENYVHAKFEGTEAELIQLKQEFFEILLNTDFKEFLPSKQNWVFGKLEKYFFGESEGAFRAEIQRYIEVHEIFKDWNAAKRWGKKKINVKEFDGTADVKFKFEF